uniref:Macrosialin n=1 Tax=Panthera tigris altaica TaxID=74533 RepID=A0A8C9JS90_PANTA
QVQILCLPLLGSAVPLPKAQGTVNSCPHKKSATLLPSFTVTPTATESTARPATTSHRTTTAGATSHEPTTATHHTVTTPRGRRVGMKETSDGTAALSYETAELLQAWGISVLNPNKTKAQGDCEGAHTHLLLSFPYGQLSFGFKQVLHPHAVYLSYVALEYNVSLPQAAQWTFSVENSSLHALQAPLGQSFSCGNASLSLSPALRLDLTAATPPCPPLRPGFPCPTDQFLLLPLVIGLVSLGLLALVLATFCIVRRRPPTYQPL